MSNKAMNQWVLSQTGLAIASPQTTSTMEWSLIREVRELREFWLFMITKESGYLLPRRILDEATEETLRERLQEWVGDRLKRRTSRGRT